MVAGFRVKDAEGALVVVGTDGHLAPATEAAEKAFFEFDGELGLRAEDIGVFRKVFAAALDSNGTLAGCGHDLLGAEFSEGEAYVLGDVEAIQTCSGEKRGFAFAFSDFAQAGADVTANRCPFGLGEKLSQLLAAAWAASGNGLGSGALDAVDKHVFHSGARQVAGDGEAFGTRGGHVLRTVDGELGSAIKEGVFQFLREEADAAALLERPTEALVDFGAELQIREALLGELLSEPRAHHLRLLESKRAFSGGDLD